MFFYLNEAQGVMTSVYTLKNWYLALALSPMLVSR